jgi:hypothetical protein
MGIRHWNRAAFFNVVNDGLRQAQLASGSLVDNLVALFPRVDSGNSPAVLEDNRIRMRRGTRKKERNTQKHNAPSQS